MVCLIMELFWKTGNWIQLDLGVLKVVFRRKSFGALVS